MRTANKLLLSFVAFFVLLMLFSDIVLWANFKDGKTGDGDLPKGMSEHLGPRLDLKVNVIVKTGKADLQISGGDPTVLIYAGDDIKKQFEWVQQHDTLYMKALEDRGMVAISNIKQIIVAEGQVTISSCNSSDLKIIMADSSKASLTNSKIRKLDILAGRGTALKLDGNESVIDSFALKMGAGSALRSYDVLYHQTAIKVDSLKELELTGRSLSSLKEIK
jgi:hypothetical protein